MSALTHMFDWARPHKKRVFLLNEGSINDKHNLGAKGANLCEMFRIGMPIPAAFIISSECCTEYFQQKSGHYLSSELVNDYKRGVHELEMQTGKQFGLGTTYAAGSPSLLGQSQQTQVKMPLLLSVRAGAAVSMPGMLDTILNLGINDHIVEHMARLQNNPRWAYDTYRRFLQMFGTVVLGADKAQYELVMEEACLKRGVPHESLLPMADLMEVVRRFKLIVSVPDDPWEQLDLAIQAVFRSWNTPRAVKYRDINDIRPDLGTAVTVQSMVYGNLNAQSGSGVAFTRNPTTGDKELFGEYLANSEGDDVSGGGSTPVPLTDLRTQLPAVFDALMHVERTLERHFRDMQDIEFTVENKTLYILETRAAKRTAQAAVRVAVGMVKERIITEREALLRLDPALMDYFMHPVVDHEKADSNDPAVKELLVCTGAPASSGAAVGVLVFTVADAMLCQAQGQPSVLMLKHTSVDELEGFKAAEGVITLRGGVTSHAAVLMRSLGKPAVVAAQDVTVDWEQQTLSCADNSKRVARRGDTVTVDGNSGTVYFGALPTVHTGTDANFMTVLQWADKYKRMSVLADADTAEEAAEAMRMGAEGIGLCRTEGMFSRPDRLLLFRRAILCEQQIERSSWLHQLLPLMQQDFHDLFRAVGDRLVIIRLLDPPLHEFLPSPGAGFQQDIADLAQRLQMSPDECERRVLDLQESNPMLGLRGCRLSIVYPEITEMQTKAIVGAAIQARQEGIEVKPQILIPMVVTDHEVDAITAGIVAAAQATCSLSPTRYSPETLEISVGAVVETPRACIRADRIAEANHVGFVSIGSNDLTQLVFGMSRSDAHSFMPIYQDLHLVAQDPYTSLDFYGVGGMIQMAARRAKRGAKEVKVGVTGEHSGDARSVAFFDHLQVDYVSCSPYRIPIAKVAAAQAHIEDAATKFEAEQRQRVTPPFPMGPYMGPFMFSHYYRRL